MRVIIFDTETNGLPKMGNKSAPDPVTQPYVCQLSWLVYDDVTEKLYTKDYIIRLIIILQQRLASLNLGMTS